MCDKQPEPSMMRAKFIPGVLEVWKPIQQTLPIVISIPHCGRNYPENFLEQTQLNSMDIRSSEDAFVDEIFAEAPKLGAPLIKALFPRAYVDPNREAYELDPNLFDGPLPKFVNTLSSRAAIGLGTVPGIVSYDKPIYDHKISFIEAQDRIERCYYPYHAHLECLIHKTVDQFGYCILLDCHSMPSDQDNTPGLADIILGDRFGTTCAPNIVNAIEAELVKSGYTVARNAPYAGGYTTESYGSPKNHIHALQIEILRKIYMCEESIQPNSNLAIISRHLLAILKIIPHPKLPT